jgi:hypothetical protein
VDESARGGRALHAMCCVAGKVGEFRLFVSRDLQKDEPSELRHRGPPHPIRAFPVSKPKRLAALD